MKKRFHDKIPSTTLLLAFPNLLFDKSRLKAQPSEVGVGLDFGFSAGMRHCALFGRAHGLRIFPKRARGVFRRHPREARAAGGEVLVRDLGRPTCRPRRPMTMMSPSCRRPIGPPTAASGPTWPMQKPRVAPEKRPSVINATLSPLP